MMISNFLSKNIVKRIAFALLQPTSSASRKKRYSFSNNLNINAFCFRISLPNNKGCSWTIDVLNLEWYLQLIIHITDILLNLKKITIKFTLAFWKCYCWFNICLAITQTFYRHLFCLDLVGWSKTISTTVKLSLFLKRLRQYLCLRRV